MATVGRQQLPLHEIHQRRESRGPAYRIRMEHRIEVVYVVEMEYVQRSVILQSPAEISNCFFINELVSRHTQLHPRR